MIQNFIIEELSALSANTDNNILEASIIVAEKYDIEIEIMAKMVQETPHLYTKLKQDAIELHLINVDDDDEDVLPI